MPKYSQEKRKWATPLCGCCSYRDPKGKSHFFPDFCPTAMICSNMIAGKICTKSHDEQPCCLGLGPKGCLLCVAALPVSIYAPLGGFGLFCCISHYLRKKIVREYNVEEETCCCGCGALNPVVDDLHFGCNYPCSMFQMYVSLQQWEYEEKQLIVETGSPVIATVLSPVNPK